MRQDNMGSLGTLPPTITNFPDESSALITQTAQALTGAHTVSLTLHNSGVLVRTPLLPYHPSDPLPVKVFPNEGIEGDVLAHVAPLVVPDTAADVRTRLLAEAGFKRAWCEPLMHDGSLVGTLLALFTVASEPTAKHELGMRLACQQAAQIVSQHNRIVEADRAAREMATVLETARAITSTLEPSTLFDRIASSLQMLITCDGAMIFAYERERELLRMVTGLGPAVGRVGGATIPMDEEHSIAVQVAKSRKPRNRRPGEGEMGVVTQHFLGGVDLNLLSVPLVSKDELKGVVMLARDHHFAPAELNTLIRLSNLFAAALENVDLYQTSQANRERLDAMYDAASDLIALVNGERLLLEVNPAFAALAGRTRDELRGLPCESAFGPTSGELFGPTGALATCLLDGTPFSDVACSVSVPQADSSEKTRFLEFAVTAIEGQIGRRALLIGRDMTAQHEMEAERANVLGMIAHDLGGPIRGMRESIRRVLEERQDPLTSAQRTDLNEALIGGNYINNLIQDIVQLSHSDAGSLRLELAPLDVGRLAEQVRDEMQGLADISQISLTAQAHSRLPTVMGDSQRLEQVLRNLIGNAIKFTPLGGSVTVTVAGQREPSQGAQVVIAVADTGRGIPKEAQAHVFERFFQVNSTSRPGGFGLGLAIVKLFVDAHHGKVKLDSVPGKGSIFTVTLPALT